MSGPLAGVPIGVFRGRACGMAAIESYEAWLGRPVDYVLDFMMERPPTWDHFEQGNVTGSATISTWSGGLGSRRLALGVPACCVNTTWADEARGANDGHWTNLGNLLVSEGFADAVVRLGREMNSWYPWQVRPASVPDYIAGFRHVVTLLRGVSGQSFTFQWNPIQGPGTLAREGVTAAYPGDPYVDEIGVDSYDTDWSGIYDTSFRRSPRAQKRVWRHLLTQADGYQDWGRFAAAHGKPLVLPEWGLRLWRDAGVYHGGGDNALFIRNMAAWMNEVGVRWHAFWEHEGVGVFDPDDHPGRIVAVPQARAAWLEEFGTS